MNVKIIPNQALKELLYEHLGNRNAIYIVAEGNAVDEWKRKERAKALGKGRKRPIKCLNNSLVYPSITEAAKELKLDAKAISKVLKKKQRTTQGYSFIYQ